MANSDHAHGHGLAQGSDAMVSSMGGRLGGMGGSRSGSRSSSRAGLTSDSSPHVIQSVLSS